MENKNQMSCESCALREECTSKINGGAVTCSSYTAVTLEECGAACVGTVGEFAPTRTEADTCCCCRTENSDTAKRREINSSL